MIAVSIFSIGILVFLVYSLNYGGEAKEIFEKLDNDAKFILGNILSEGYPPNWDEDVVKIGVLSNDRIDEDKLKKFLNLSTNDYQKTKTLFNTKYDYYFFMDKKIVVDSVEVDGIGKPGSTRDNVGENLNLIKITRFSIYQNEAITVYLYAWE